MEKLLHGFCVQSDVDGMSNTQNSMNDGGWVGIMSILQEGVV